MLSVNFGVKDTDKSVIPCTESPKRDSSIIAIVVYFVFYKVMMVEPSHPYVAPSHCLNPAQRVSETFHSPSDEADGKLCRSCFSALPSKQQGRLFWVHRNTKRYAVHTEASKLSRCKSSCCGRLKKTEKLFFLLAMTRYPAVNTVVNFFFLNYNGSARMLNIGMYHTIDMVLSEAV